MDYNATVLTTTDEDCPAPFSQPITTNAPHSTYDYEGPTLHHCDSRFDPFAENDEYENNKLKPSENNSNIMTPTMPYQSSPFPTFINSILDSVTNDIDFKSQSSLLEIHSILTGLPTTQLKSTLTRPKSHISTNNTHSLAPETPDDSAVSELYLNLMYAQSTLTTCVGLAHTNGNIEGNNVLQTSPQQQKNCQLPYLLHYAPATLYSTPFLDDLASLVNDANIDKSSTQTSPSATFTSPLDLNNTFPSEDKAKADFPHFQPKHILVTKNKDGRVINVYHDPTKEQKMIHTSHTAAMNQEDQQAAQNMKNVFTTYTIIFSALLAIFIIIALLFMWMSSFSITCFIHLINPDYDPRLKATCFQNGYATTITLFLIGFLPTITLLSVILYNSIYFTLVRFHCVEPMNEIHF